MTIFTQQYSDANHKIPSLKAFNRAMSKRNRPAIARPNLQQRSCAPATVTLTLPQTMQQALAAERLVAVTTQSGVA